MLVVCFFDKQNLVKISLLPAGAVKIVLVWGPIKAPSGSKNGVMERGSRFQKNLISREAIVKDLFK